MGRVVRPLLEECAMSIVQFRRAIVVAAAIFLVWANASGAQVPGDGSDKSTRSSDAARKAEADIRLAVRDAQRLSTTDANKAVQRLQNALVEVENSSGLPDERRTALKRMLKARTRVTEQSACGDAESIAKAVRKTAKKLVEDDGASDQERIRRLMDEIKNVQTDGKLGQDKLRLTEMAGK